VRAVRPVRLRPATVADLPWAEAVARHPEIEPALAPGAADGLADAVERGELLVDDERRGAVRLVVVVQRHRLAAIRTLMVDPRARGQGVGAAIVRAVADEAFGARGLHRLEAEVYGFNDAALRLFDRAGFTRDGVRRRAWERHGAWQDGVICGLLAEDRRG
jgi:ribosomal protein S18 acetylase RimI-like enzyme